MCLTVHSLSLVKNARLRPLQRDKEVFFVVVGNAADGEANGGGWEGSDGQHAVGALVHDDGDG